MMEPQREARRRQKISEGLKRAYSNGRRSRKQLSSEVKARISAALAGRKRDPLATAKTAAKIRLNAQERLKNTLLKTCTSCREQKPLEAFYYSRGFPRSRCKVCFNQRRSRRSYAWRKHSLSYKIRHRRRSAIHLKRYQRESLSHASMSGESWSVEECEAVLRKDLTTRQLAAQLGRTYAAVGRRRTILRTGWWPS